MARTTRDKGAEAEAIPYQDYLRIDRDNEDKYNYSVSFERNCLNREQAVRIYRAILKSLWTLEEEDIAEDRI